MSSLAVLSRNIFNCSIRPSNWNSAYRSGFNFNLGLRGFRQKQNPIKARSYNTHSKVSAETWEGSATGTTISRPGTWSGKFIDIKTFLECFNSIFRWSNRSCCFSWCLIVWCWKFMLWWTWSFKWDRGNWQSSVRIYIHHVTRPNLLRRKGLAKDLFIQVRLTIAWDSYSDVIADWVYCCVLHQISGVTWTNSTTACPQTLSSQ